MTGWREATSTLPEAVTERNRPNTALLSIVVAIVGLGAVAVAQPILQVVGADPGYLVAHDLGRFEVLVFPVFLVAAALIPAGLVLVAHRLSPRLGVWAAALGIGALTALIVLHVGVSSSWPGVVTGSAAVVAGSIAVGLYGGNEAVRRWGGMLALLPPVVVGWFWLSLPPSLITADGAEAATVERAEPNDVVVMIFDELPLSSVVDSEGELLADLFPGFGRLAEDGTWYRDAVTVETLTAEAVPAILTGSAVTDGAPPVASAYPNTVMNLMSETHDVTMTEAITDLCPPSVCTRRRGPAFDRWSVLMADTAIVFAHLVTPPSLSASLPPIDAAWAGFGRDEGNEDTFDVAERLADARQADRRVAVEGFLDRLPGAGSRPTVAVGHFLLPHRPWVLLPDGTSYEPESPPGYVSRGWGTDEYFLADGWRRHMLQVGYVDGVVSDVVAALEEAGRYQSALLIVLADHGVAFIPGVADMRATNERSAGSILPVPLFVKYPAAASDVPEPGTIIDERVETVDVLPTILDVLDAEVDPTVTEAWDGRSLLDLEGREEVTRIRLRGEPFDFGPAMDETRSIAARREAWFSTDLFGLVPDPTLADLPGSPVTGARLVDDQSVEVDIDRAGVTVTGTVAPASVPRPAHVAVVLDGRVVAVTKAYAADDADRLRFSAMVPPGKGRVSDQWSAWYVDPSDPRTLRR